MDYKIYVTYHNDDLVEKHHLSEDEHHVLFASHREIDGENINALNPVYSEMVTMYYVWKNNLKTDYVGFEHYRRHLKVLHMPKDGECQIYLYHNMHGLTVYKQYAKWHNVSDLDTILSIVDEKYGKGNIYTTYIKESDILIPNCTFVMKWEDFTSLCEFMFPILEEFGKRCGMEDGFGTLEDWTQKAVKDFGKEGNIIYQRRVVSFLAERLISAWIYNNLKQWNGIDVAVVHYNTPKLTSAAVMSLNKYCPKCHITVFDNSDLRPFVNNFDNVEVIDNTKGQIIDFDKMLSKFPKKENGDRNKSNFGSAKHCKSVDVLMKYLPNGFILIDSDILLFAKISAFIDTTKAIIGNLNKKEGIELIDPFICWINVPMLKKNKISYFNGSKMWALSDKYPNNRYDTGAWVLEAVKNKKLPWGSIDIWKYIVHFGHGSWREKNVSRWLESHENLFK